VLLYLDYDGVLHPQDVYRHPKRGIHLAGKYEGHTLFEHAELLADELEPYPRARIVLSTSWVRVLRYRRALSYLPERLQARVVGATFHSSRMDKGHFMDLSRGQQVLGDVGRRGAKRWLALDDDAENWPTAHRAYLVRTDPEHGLAAVLDEFRERLRELMKDLDGYETPSDATKAAIFDAKQGRTAAVNLKDL
jgi:hypothetical protein